MLIIIDVWERKVDVVEISRKLRKIFMMYGEEVNV
jgi:hypothetical protein